MKILVCFKLQPDPDRVLEGDLGSFSPGMDLGYAGLAFNCFDESALELGIRLKEAAVQDSSCTALTVSQDIPGDFTERLLAVGYDRVVCVQKAHTEFCPEDLAREIAGVGKDYDLILMGKEAGFGESGMVPYLTAACLKIPVISGVEALGDAGSFLCRDPEGLWERRLNGPAVAIVGNSPAVLRAPTLRQRMKCRGRTAEVLEPVTEDREVIPSLSRMETGRACRMLDPEAPETYMFIRRLMEEAVQGQKNREENRERPLISEALPVFLGDPQEGARASDIPDVSLILLPDTHAGRTLGAELSRDRDMGCCFGATILGADEQAVHIQKRAFGGSLLREEKLTYPAAVTCLNLRDLGEPAVLPGNPENRGRLMEPAEASNLEAARAVVACGNGMGSREACGRGRKLARDLGASFGLTRPGALNAWGSPGEILGQSGLQIRPDCCLVLGAAGAGAFLLGIRQAGTIIAVNQDPNALIFKSADYGIRMDVNLFLEHFL